MCGYLCSCTWACTWLLVQTDSSRARACTPWAGWGVEVGRILRSCGVRGEEAPGVATTAPRTDAPGTEQAGRDKITCHGEQSRLDHL